MSIRSAARRWGLPATVMIWLLLPLWIAGCPWDGLPDDAPWWFAFPDVPQECKACYAEFMGVAYDVAADQDNDGVPDDWGEGGTETGSPGGEGEGGTQTGAPAGSAVDPDPNAPQNQLRQGPPAAVTRPQIDPDLRHVPNYKQKQTPNYQQKQQSPPPSPTPKTSPRF